MAAGSQEVESPEGVAVAESEAERVVRIQKVIESDQARLTELKQELKVREDAFEASGESLAEREAKLKNMEAQLEDTADPADKSALQATLSVAQDGSFVDAQTKSRWGIEGRAVEGPLKGRTIRWVDSVQCRWFAWAAEYPETELYAPAKTSKTGDSP